MADDTDEPIRLTVAIEAVCEVVDAGALANAAVADVESRTYVEGSVDPETGLSEQEADRQRATGHPREALDLAIDPGSGLDAIPGIELAEAAWSVDPCRT